MEDNLKRKDDESVKKYKLRLFRNKDLYNIKTQEIADLINKETENNFNESTFRKWYKAYEEGYTDAKNEKSDNSSEDITTIKREYDGYEQIKSYKEVIEINKDGSRTSDKLIGIEDETKLKDEDYLLSVHGYDPKLWEIVSARNSIWNTQLKGGLVTKLYASKINVKPRVSNISLEEVKESFEKFTREYKPNNIKKYTNEVSKGSGKILELPIMDLHFNKKSYSFETGENIDNNITENRFLKVVDDIINRTKHYSFEKIIFPVGQDFFNSDTIENTTTKGTRQDNDLRWQEMFLKGVQLLIKAIDKLSYIAPVEVFYVAGNHDKMVSYYATNYLYAWYRNDKRVSVAIEPQIRKYIEYGNCLIGYSHGSEEKKRINSLMQIEVPEAWGRTKYREWHLGHLHHETLKEENGVIVRGLSTITGTDAWHYESGYVGNIKKQQAFIWDKIYGLTDILNSVIV